MLDTLLRSLAVDADVPPITREFDRALFEPDFKIRADGDGRTITGVVVPFDRVARVSDGGPAYEEMFRMGAFAKTINDGRRVKLLSQHMAGRNPLGVSTELREDPVGLIGTFKVSNTGPGNDALELVRDGALDSFSVGFAPIKHSRQGKVTVRTEVALREASLVTFPAYAEARITAVRATLDEIESLTAEERAELIRALTLKDYPITQEHHEPIEDGTSPEAATLTEPASATLLAPKNRSAWRNAFRAELIAKGITQ